MVTGLASWCENTLEYHSLMSDDFKGLDMLELVIGCEPHYPYHHMLLGSGLVR